MCMYLTTLTFHRTESFGGLTGKVQLVVTDGVTLGHPCCMGALNCKNPLPNNKAIYCDDHSYMRTICAVVSCSEQVVPVID
jgi:CxC6 like cysteine cluster associated with KDZ transposases